jgi:cell division initiation protein
MDVTPRELRDVEIREAFRGYNRDEVNDLLERAAVAIEGMSEKVRVLTERLSTQGESSGGASGSSRGETEDMLHRTLLLAQRASDEAIAEAQEKAAAMVEDAETRSRRMLADAAIEARRTTESERHRLEHEIKELQARRELLSTDVDGLEHFETEYRARLTTAMEADLHAIERDLESIRVRSAAAPGERPTFNDDETIDPATMEVDVRAYLDDKARPLVGSGGGGPNDSEAEPAPTASAPSDVVTASADTPTPDTGDTGAVDGDGDGDGTTIDLFGEEQAASEAAALDDDSFFASLRDAVRDDAPLGPRDDSERAFFDQDDSKDAPTFREAFKRRR